MIYEDLKVKHHLTRCQLLHVHAVCARFEIDTSKLDDWTPNMTIIGEPTAQRVHVRHSDKVLHVDVFNARGDGVHGSSWALTPGGVQYAARGVQDV